MGTPVSEVDAEPDGEPDKEPQPVLQTETEHESHVKEDSENGNQRHEWSAERPRQVRMGLAHHENADADENEGKESADARHLTHDLNRSEGSEQADKNHEEQVAAPWGMEPGMQIRE